MSINIKKIENEVSRVTEKKLPFDTIDSAEQLEKATEYLGIIKNIRDRIDEYFDPIIKNAHSVWKDLHNKKNAIDSEPASMERTLRRMISIYQHKLEQERRDAQRKLDEAARKQAIKDAQKDGDTKTAKAIETGKMAVVSPKAPAPVVTPKGMSSRKKYRAEVVNFMQLVQAVAKNIVPLDYIEVNQSALNKLADATKGKATIPGVKFTEETIAVFRSR